MPEKGSRSPASGVSAFDNLVDILKEKGIDWSARSKASRAASDITDALRMELSKKNLPGFKRGGRIKKTGLAKVHKGERVLTAKQAKAHAKTASKRTAARRASPRRRTPR